MTQATSAALGREYETIYVLRPDITGETAKKLATRVQEVVGGGGAQLTQFETWGRRQMAYPVKRFRHGIYVYLKYVGEGPVVTELERNLRLIDDVIKYQTVKLRGDVDRSGLTVDPASVSLEELELTPYEYEEESRERELGLVESVPSRMDEEGSSRDDEDSGTEENTNVDEENRS